MKWNEMHAERNRTVKNGTAHSSVIYIVNT